MSNWKTIRTYTYPQEAYVARSFLESEGIAVFLKDELTTQVHNFYSNALGGVKLQVDESESKKGLDLLRQGGFIKSSEEMAEESIEAIYVDRIVKPHCCPFCNSDDIAKKKDPNILAVVIYFILGILFPIFRSDYTCYDCGKTWNYSIRKRKDNNARH